MQLLQLVDVQLPLQGAQLLLAGGAGGFEPGRGQGRLYALRKHNAVGLGEIAAEGEVLQLAALWLEPGRLGQH